MTRTAEAALLIGLLTSLLAACSSDRLQLDTLRVPSGFAIEIFAADVPGARSLALGDNGTVFVSTRGQGVVYAITDGRVLTLANGMNMPNGIAFRDGDLFVAEVNRVWRFRDIESRLQDPPEPELVSDAFPSDSHHGWKFIAFAPDGRLVVPVGAPCNICDEEGYARITLLDVDTGAVEVFAHGVRNTVGFDFHPQTGELWFTDNGRDWLGDDSPPDELNHAPRAGMHFGYPYCHGNSVQDPDFPGRACEEFTPPVQELGPHVAALGMRFYDGGMFPDAYRGQVFIAEHGSWNRTTKIGYRVTMVTLENGRAVSYQPFVDGWLRPGGSAWGRPVDVLVMPDGAMLVSDDHAGAVYRVTWRGR